MDKKRMNYVFDAYQARYSSVLNKIWPTMGSNGFNEHNQTVNFMIAYETVAEENNEQISTWYEFQISNGTKRNNRIDGLIINHTKREVYLIEAKRFSKNNLQKKQKELGNDYTRIENLGLGRFEELFYEKESISTYKVFGVLLFDLWTETPAQEGLLKNWNNICDNPSSDLLSDFFYFNNSDSKIDCAKSCLLPIVREVICNRWKDENYSYFLGALIWGKSNKE